MLRSVCAGLVMLLAACAPASTVQPAVPAASPTALLRAIPAAHGLRVGERRTVRAVVEDGNELIAAIPIDATSKIESPAIAALENGTLVGVAPGVTTMHVSDGAGRTVDVPIVVTESEPLSLSIDVPPGAPRLGERIPVRAVIRYADGTIADATLDTDWSTTTTGRLFVPNTTGNRGAVVAIMAKPSTLVARLGALEARTEIAPAFGEPSGIHVRLAWSYGNFRRFGAFAHWPDGATREVSAGCLWRVPGEGAFRGIERPQHGPWLPTSALSWDRLATCELGTTKGSGALFAE